MQFPGVGDAAFWQNSRQRPSRTQKAKGAPLWQNQKMRHFGNAISIINLTFSRNSEQQ
jgi:hypothetical protein